jgi:hypothetical protein
MKLQALISLCGLLVLTLSSGCGRNAWAAESMPLEGVVPRAGVEFVVNDLRDQLDLLSGQVAAWPSRKQEMFLRLLQAELLFRARRWRLIDPDVPRSGEEGLLFEWLANEYFQHGRLADALHHRQLAACSFAESRNLLRRKRGGVYTVSNCVMPELSVVREELRAHLPSPVEHEQLLTMRSHWSSLSSLLSVLEARASSSRP